MGVREGRRGGKEGVGEEVGEGVGEVGTGEMGVGGGGGKER